jgi:hypothetical protein
MGILDRIAGTLEELTGDAQATMAAEVERARALAGQGDEAAAETLLAELGRRSPRAPLPFLTLTRGSGRGRRRARPRRRSRGQRRRSLGGAR